MSFDKSWVKFEISRLKTDAENVLSYVDSMYAIAELEGDRDNIIYFEELSNALFDAVDSLRETHSLIN